MRKKKWEQPLLIVLVRKEPCLTVMDTCKIHSIPGGGQIIGINVSTVTIEAKTTLLIQDVVGVLV